jgi:hypothetical protein
MVYTRDKTGGIVNNGERMVKTTCQTGLHAAAGTDIILILREQKT